MTTGYDMRTGRPLHGGEEAVETLTDDELEAELTIAVLEPARRERRYEQLWRELMSRHRGYTRRGPGPHPV